MPSLSDFKAAAKLNLGTALKAYDFYCDEVSLDKGGTGVQRHGPYPVEVEFTYDDSGGRPVITMRACQGSKRWILYLPWQSGIGNSLNGIAKVSLDGTTKPWFFTSNLDGCRTTVLYHDADCKSCTVMHLAGDVSPDKGAGRKTKYDERDYMQNSVVQQINNHGTPIARKRSFSIGVNDTSKPPLGITTTKAFEKLKTNNPNTIYYMGGKGSFMGQRMPDGKWIFYAQDIMSGINRNEIHVMT